MKPYPRQFSWLVLGVLVTFAASVRAAEPKREEAKSSTARGDGTSLAGRIWEAIAPLSMQKRPLIQFNVFTEKTPEGRERREPTPEKPMYYMPHAGKFKQMGAMVSAGERPPPVAELETAMKSTLAANGYLAISQSDQRPEILIMFNYGSHGTDPAALAPIGDDPPPVSAEELLPIVLGDSALFRDVIERATLVAGEKFARELKAALDGEVQNMKINQSQSQSRTGMPPADPPIAPVSPQFGSPYQNFIRGKNSAVMAHLAEVAFHTCYFVIASAYDYASFEKQQPRLLWRTKMTVEAQGVAMNEVLTPLIANAGPYMGREMSEVTIVKKRIDREGKVEIGTPTVVEGVVPRPSERSSTP